jgi:hypothetical protein
MKRKVWLGLLALAAALVIGSVALAQKETTVEGTLVDSACYLKDNSLTGNDHGPMKQCGTMCLKGGTPAGVLTKSKKFHAVIAPSTALADYVGQPVRVRGTIHNESILANKVEVNKDGKWVEIKLGAMM